MDATKRPPPPPAARNSSPPSRTEVIPTRTISVNRGMRDAGEKFVIYGPGGVGKTTLASLLAELGIELVFIDIGDSTSHLDVARAEVDGKPPTSFDDVRSVLNDREQLSHFGAVVIDDFTTLEELAKKWVIQNVHHEKGASYKTIKSIEDYGFGKGYVHIYDAFQLVLGDLDRVARSGKHVLATAHEQTVNVPNPAGEDWLQYQPRLMSSKQAQLRERVKEWCYHLLYLNFDVAVDKDGKGTGVGTRSITTSPTATHWAKSRKLDTTISYEFGSPEIWKQLLSKE